MAITSVPFWDNSRSEHSHKKVGNSCPLKHTSEQII